MNTTILDHLEITERRFGDKIAYADKDGSVTFTELRQKASALGSCLLEKGFDREPVVIFMCKGVKNIVSFFGAAYAGCFYVPIDVDMPEDRIRLIFSVLSPRVAIFDDSSRKKVTGSDLFNGIAFLDYDESAFGDRNDNLLAAARKDMKSTDLLYVLFTSGSTGVPKGVTISHAAVLDFMEWICARYELDENVILCSQAPFYFDASLPDLVIPICVGATLMIPPKTYYTFPKKILHYIVEHRINTLIWVPSALCNVVNCNAFEVCVPDSVKLVIFCGEVMPCRHLNVWRHYISDAKYVNMYGPTEATYACTYYDIDREYADDEKLPLGRACENSSIILLGENGEPAGEGEIGEICILGQCLSNGYYNNIEKTSEAFVQNPLNTKWIELMYKTGDLARSENGVLIFEGRKDFQIKRLGHRIELGEIENAILSNPEVRQACCVFDPESCDISAIYAGELEEAELSGRLKDLIPHYMMPNAYHKLAALPLNLNGKIDRVKLSTEYGRK